VGLDETLVLEETAEVTLVLTGAEWVETAKVLKLALAEVLLLEDVVTG